MILASFFALFDLASWGGETQVFAVIIAGVFGSGLIGLVYHTIRGSQMFGGASRDSKHLESYFKKYERTFLNGTDEKSSLHASEVFPIQQLVFNQGLLSSLPGLLVGLGILGTFVGLSIGVMGLKSQESAAAVQEGIQALLNSMGTAFVTSVLGMGTSIIFTMLQRASAYYVAKKYRVFCARLDDRHFISSEESGMLEEQRIEAMLVRMFGVMHNDEATTPGQILMRNLQANQSAAGKLDQFGNELADGLALSANTISAIEESLGGRFQELFRANLGGYLQNIEGSLKTMENQDASDAKSFSDTLEATLSNLIDSFKSELSEGARNEMVELQKGMANTAQSIAELPSIIESTKEGFKSMVAQFENLGNELTRNISEQLSKAAEEAAKVQVDGAKEASQAANEFVKGTDAVTSKMIESLSAFMKTNSASVQEIAEVIDRVQALLKEHEHSSQAIGSAITGLTHASSSLERNTGEMNSSFQAMSGLNTSMERISNALNAVTTGMNDVVKEQQSALEMVFGQAKASLNEQLSAYGEVNDQLAQIKDAYIDSLEHYQAQVNQAVNSNLEGFASQLTGVAEGLTAAYTALQETVGEMEGVVSRTANELR